jgi:hypothetical protein
MYELAYVKTGAPTLASMNTVALFQADILNPLYSIPIVVMKENGERCSARVCLCLLNLQKQAGLPSASASIRKSFYYGAGAGQIARCAKTWLCLDSY